MTDQNPQHFEPTPKEERDKIIKSTIAPPEKIEQFAILSTDHAGYHRNMADACNRLGLAGYKIESIERTIEMDQYNGHDPLGGVAFRFSVLGKLPKEGKR